MKLNNSVFFNEYFTEAFKRLLTFDFNSTITIRIIKSVKQIDEQQYAVMLTRDKILKETAKVNEDGSVIFEYNVAVFTSPENKTKFETRFSELIRDEFDIPITEKIKLTKAHVISGNHLDALQNIVEVIDDGGK